MNELLDYINKKTNNTYKKLKLVGVVFDKEKNLNTFRFVYDYPALYQKNKEEIIGLIKDFYKGEIDIDVKLAKSYLDEDAIKNLVFKQFGGSTDILGFERDDIDVIIDGTNVLVTMLLKPDLYDHYVSQNMARKIEIECEKYFFATFKVLLSKTADTKTQDILAIKEREIESQYFDDTPVYSEYKVENPKLLFGQEISNAVMPIKAIKGELDYVEVGGVVNYFIKKPYIKKTKTNPNGEERYLYRFALKYDEATINCTYFPTRVDGEKIEELQDGDQIVVSGKVEAYNENLSVRVKGITQCTLPEITPKEVKERTCPEQYTFVCPEPYINPTQENFLLSARPVNEFLKQNDVVVFDFETTGLDYQTCEIIEIGAVKIHEGKLTETFSCFVKPNELISAEITSITNITNQMVKDAHSISEVIPDFYKFCHNCVIVAYNIDFDYKFLNKAGTKIGYKFNNRQVDALYLARKEVKGAKTFNLKSIATKLGVNLDNAHRAINDAIATAEVLLLISDNVSPK